MYNNTPNTRYNNVNRSSERYNSAINAPLEKTKKISDLNVNEAENFVKTKLINDKGKIVITTSQIRKFLSAVNCLENKVLGVDELSKELLNEIKYLKVKLAYQAGRENKIKTLYNELEPLINQISNKNDFTKVARYIEAIVAYHKFNGGE